MVGFSEKIKPENKAVEREKKLFSDSGGRLIELGRRFKKIPKKLSEAVGLLLLLEAVAGFAEANVEKPRMDMSPESVKTGKLLNPGPQFAWKKFVRQIEISYEMESESPEAGIDFEVVGGADIDSVLGSDFYKDMSIPEYCDTRSFLVWTLMDSDSAEEFFAAVAEGSEALSDLQKIYLLQEMGKDLRVAYDEDIVKKGEGERLSDDIIFQALKDYWGEGSTKSGICGNAHTFMARVAREMGLEAWTQLNTVGDEHVFMGLLAGVGRSKQIVFCDYDDVIPTGTLNYQKALGIAERYHRYVNLFGTAVSNPGEVPLFIESLATQQMRRAANIEETGEKLEKFIEDGRLFETRDGFKVELGGEAKTIAFSKGMMAMSFYGYGNAGSPYNSLESLQGLGLQFKRPDFGANISILHLNVGDLDGKVLSQNEIVADIFKGFLKDFKVSENWQLRVGALLDSAMSFSLGSNLYSTELEGGSGARLVYINPSQTRKFWVGTEGVVKLQKDSADKQDLTVRIIEKSLKLGAEIEVREGTLLNLEAIGKKTSRGSELGLEAGIETDKLKARAKAEKQSSERKRFFPDRLRIEGAIGYQTPIGEIDIFGALEEEEYKDAPAEKDWQVGLKYRIVLWR